MHRLYTARETAIFHNIHISSNEDSRTNRQLGKNTPSVKMLFS